MQIPNSKLIIVVLLLGLGPLSAHLWLQNGRLEQRALEAEARASAPVVAQPAPKRLRRAVVRPRLAPVRSGDTLDSLLGQLKLTTSEATAADVVRRLGAIGPEAIGALSELVEDERARIATAAAESLGRIGGPGPLGLLEDLIYRRDWTRLSVGADGLALSDDALALPLLIRALSEPVTYGRRGPLLRALGATQKPDAVGALTQSLYDGAPNMRREAAGALARSAVGRGVLLDALADSTPLTIRRDALAALSRSLDPRVDVAVEQVLAMPFSALKPQAIQALGRREGSEERLTLFLLQGTQSERMAAANALAERDTAAASEVLAAALPNAARSDRSSIVYALSRMGHPRAVETMRGLLRHPNPEIHHAAASALVYQRPDILASLDPASVPRGVRGHVFSALAAVDPEGALPVLTAAIRGGFGPDAQTAVTALANVPGDEARGILLEALDTGGPLMSSALNALGGVSGLPPEARGKLLAQIQSGSASPQLFYSLGSDGSGADASLQTALVGAIQNGSTQTRDAAAQALARAGGPQSAGLLASIITDPATDTATSRSALNALASAGGAEAARTVSALARDGDKDAIRALRMLDGKKSVDTLMEIYQGKDAALADEAFSVLSNSQQPEALDVLLDVAGSDSPRASTAIYGLAARHDPAAREAVLDAAWSGKTEVRRAAIGTLSNNAADADALPVLARGLHDDNASVATAAVNALRYRPGRAATQALVGVLGQDVPNSLKAQVAAALKTRGGKAARDNKALIDQALAETNPSAGAVAANPVRHWFTLDDVLTSPSFPGLLLE